MTIQSANYLCIWLWASIPRCHTFPGSWDGGRTLGPEARDARSCHAVPCPERQVTQWFSTFLAWRNSFWDEHLHALQQVLDNLFIRFCAFGISGEVEVYQKKYTTTLSNIYVTAYSEIYVQFNYSPNYLSIEFYFIIITYLFKSYFRSKLNI